MTDEQPEEQGVKFDRKKVYFFAGPHQSASTSVESFFQKWAANGFTEKHPHSLPLQYWRWPNIDQEIGVKQYGEFVKRQDDIAFEKQALDIIAQRFEESENGVFLGTEEFDQVGPDKIYDALPVMQTILDKVGVGPEDTKVVMNYRTPRLDQWVSLWKHSNVSESTYAFFLCQASNPLQNDYRLRRSMVGAATNPLMVAKTFLEKGWSVTLLDMSGVDKAGKHIVHTIGCDVLQGWCPEDGMLGGGLKDYKPFKMFVDKNFTGLSFQESRKTEQLFQHRDCAYKSLLEKYVKTGQLEILYQDSLWADCTAPRDYYDQFVGENSTDFMYDALLSQVKCVETFTLSTNMDAALYFEAVEAPKKSGSFFHFVLILALGAVVYQFVKKKMESSNGSFSYDSLSSAFSQYRNTATEMTPYPKRGYRDHESEDDDDDDDDFVGGFRDDTSLDDEEVSDQPSQGYSDQPQKGGSSLSNMI